MLDLQHVVLKSCAISTVILRDAETNNRLGLTMLADLEKLVDYLADRANCQAIVFRGSTQAFADGINLGEFVTRGSTDTHTFGRFERILAAIERLPMMTIALIEGRCIGWGVQLALACDLRVATTTASFQMPEVKLGFLPGMAVFRLPKLVGLGRAKRMILGAIELSAADAFEYGLVEHVCETEGLETALEFTLREYLPVNTVALRLARRLVGESYADHYEDAVGHVLAAQSRCIAQPSFQAPLAAP